MSFGLVKYFSSFLSESIIIVEDINVTLVANFPPPQSQRVSAHFAVLDHISALRRGGAEHSPQPSQYGSDLIPLLLLRRGRRTCSTHIHTLSNIRDLFRKEKFFLPMTLSGGNERMNCDI
jgi:hypothetical protein